VVKTVEARIASDAYYDAQCPDITVPDAELAPT